MRRIAEEWFQAHRPSVWLAELHDLLDAAQTMRDLGGENDAAEAEYSVARALLSWWGFVVLAVAPRGWLRLRKHRMDCTRRARAARFQSHLGGGWHSTQFHGGLHVTQFHGLHGSQVHSGGLHSVGHGLTPPKDEV